MSSFQRASLAGSRFGVQKWGLVHYLRVAETIADRIRARVSMLQP